MGVIGRNKAPFVFADVVHFTTHVVVSSNYIDLVLEKETLVRDTELVHGVEVLPGLSVGVE